MVKIRLDPLETEVEARSKLKVKSKMFKAVFLTLGYIFNIFIALWITTDTVS